MIERNRAWEMNLNQLIEKSLNTITIKKRKTTRTSEIEKLLSAKRNIKMRKLACSSKPKKALFARQEALIISYIREEQKKENWRLISNTIEEIKLEGGINGNAFWLFKKRMDGIKK